MGNEVELLNISVARTSLHILPLGLSVEIWPGMLAFSCCLFLIRFSDMLTTTVVSLASSGTAHSR